MIKPWIIKHDDCMSHRKCCRENDSDKMLIDTIADAR